MITMGAALSASVAGFYVLPDGQANNFPTYLLGVVVLLLVATHPGDLRDLIRSRVLATSSVLVLYLAASTIWSVTTTPHEILVSFANAFLILTFICAITLCRREFEDYVLVLLGLTVVAATVSGGLFIVSTVTDGLSVVPPGRLHPGSIAGIAYGLAGLFALLLAVNAGGPAMRAVWGASCLLLMVSCALLEEIHVWFAILSSLTAMAMLYSWESRTRTARLPFAIGALVVLAVIQIVVVKSIPGFRYAEIWQGVLELLYDVGPVLGQGLLTSSREAMSCDLATMAGACTVDHPHSIYVATMHYSGIVGMFLLTALLLVSTSYVLESPSGIIKTVAIGSLCYAFTVLLFDGNRLVQKIDFIWIVFWLPIGLAVSQSLQKLPGDP